MTSTPVCPTPVGATSKSAAGKKQIPESELLSEENVSIHRQLTLMMELLQTKVSTWDQIGTRGKNRRKTGPRSPLP